MEQAQKNELKKIKLLDRIDRNGGWINHIDAFELINVYIEEFDVIYTTLSIEEELSLIYYRLKGYDVFEEDFTDLIIKKCLRCGLSQKLTQFGKNWNQRDGRMGVCKICIRKDPEKSRLEFIEKEKKKKLCPKCNREYTLNEFALTSKICIRCKNRKREDEWKTTHRDMLEERGG